VDADLSLRRARLKLNYATEKLALARQADLSGSVAVMDILDRTLEKDLAALELEQAEREMKREGVPC
jgi:hypothetical protein